MHEQAHCRDEATNHQLPISCSLLNRPNSFSGGMFKLNSKSDADSLLYLLSHFECKGHTVHMLTQWHLQSPLINTVKLSLFTHAHSSPLSLSARLYQCPTNHSRYINNDWTFSRQGSQLCLLWSWDSSSTEIAISSLPSAYLWASSPRSLQCLYFKLMSSYSFCTYTPEQEGQWLDLK